MKLVEVQNQQELFYRNLCEGLSTPHMRIISEAALTADQINALFGTIEKTATDMGKNRTMVGKGVDAAGAVGGAAVDVAKLPVKALKAVDDTINKVGKWLQDTTPVKAFDTKFEQLKDQIGDKFPELEKNLTAMGTWAKENPGKTAAIVGVLTTIAGIAGGPIGGAVAGQILRGANELIKGEKLSTAIGKGAKTAAYGALAGMAFNYLSNQVTDALKTAGETDIANVEMSMSRNNLDKAWAKVDPEVAGAFDEVKNISEVPNAIHRVTYYNGPDPMTLAPGDSTMNYLEGFKVELPSTLMNPEQGEVFDRLIRAAQDAKGAAKVAEYGKVLDYLESLKDQQALYKGVLDLAQQNPETFGDLTTDQLGILANYKGDLADKIEALDNIGSATGAALQAAVQSQVGKTKDITVKKTKPDPEQAEALASQAEKAKTPSESLDEAQILRLFTAVSLHESQLEEGPLDTLKAVGRNVAQGFRGDDQQPRAITGNTGRYGGAGGKAATAVGSALGKAAGAVKGAAGSAADAVKGAAGAVADKAGEVGKGLTTRFTVAKLQKAWEKAGSPTEDTEVLKVLMDLGVDQDILDASFKTAKITMPKVPEEQLSSNVQKLLAAISKAKPDVKTAVVKYLQQATSPAKWAGA